MLLLRFIEYSGGVALSAQKMLTALAEPLHIDLYDLHINASIGTSIYPDDGQDAETLLKNADAAMYHAKENGRPPEAVGSARTHLRPTRTVTLCRWVFSY